MAYVTDKEELKPGLIIFRRANVQHGNWYCRVKVPKADRYKTISLKTNDINTARTLAWDHDGEVRYAIKHDVPLFNRSFRVVAKEYLAAQAVRAKDGQITAARVKKLKAVIDNALDRYVGSTQVHLIGDETWANYPSWRRQEGAGRNKRNGVRQISNEKALELAAREEATRVKALNGRGITAGRVLVAKPAEPPKTDDIAFISDATIGFEMSIFGAVMNFAIKKRYAPASQRFDQRPKLKTMRRDEFTRDEYRALHTRGRAWVKAATTKPSDWYRNVVYNFVLIMCGTGMRPSEAKNLRWRDITTAEDREGREIVVLFVQGKGKTRKLVAVKSVGEYLERIHEISKAKEPDDRVFTTISGEPAKSLYQALIEDLLTYAKLREGPNGVPRSTYCFRHTYATFRLIEGVDAVLLADQMGTSVKMIQDHYGHVNSIQNANLVLRGSGGWETIPAPEKREAQATQKAQVNAKAKPRTGRKD